MRIGGGGGCGDGSCVFGRKIVVIKWKGKIYGQVCQSRLG